MKIEYNFKPYSKPKRAVYYETGGNYIKDPATGVLGWEKIEKETEVIGEDDTCFVVKLIKHRNCDTTEVEYGKTVLLPMGFHKSRLIKWILLAGQQLALF